MGPFTKNKERRQRNKNTGDTRCVYQNELDKACLQHDMANVDFKHLSRRNASDKVLNKALNIDKNLKQDECQRGITPMVYNFFDKRPYGAFRELSYARQICY